MGTKFWQAYSIAWINAYNEFSKAWIDNIRLSQIPSKITDSLQDAVEELNQ